MIKLILIKKQAFHIRINYTCKNDLSGSNHQTGKLNYHMYRVLM